MNQSPVLSYVYSLFISVGALFVPLQSLIVCLFVFILVDFITGCWADYKRHWRVKQRWYFQSCKAWDTVYKFIFSVAGVVLMSLIDLYILSAWDMNLYLPNMFCGFICSVEMWSYLENAAEISNHPVFRWVRKFVKTQVEQRTGIELNDLDNKE